MEIEVPVKTEADTLAVVQAYAHIKTLNKVVAEPLAIRRLTRFIKCRPKALPTHTQLEIEFEIRESISVGRDISRCKRQLHDTLAKDAGQSNW